LHDVVGAEGDPVKAAEHPTARQEIRLWTAAVLRQDPEEPLQPVPLGRVHLATDTDVAQALRMDGYLGGAQPRAIPIGLYTSGGLEAPVYLDADFLLGPEAAHLNISGISGLATKTSAVEFLLHSIFRYFPSHKGRIAAVCFNVKGPDLCFLDRPGPLEDEDRRRYERLGLDAKPFPRVRYYAPFKADGVNLNTLRTHPDLVGDVEPLVWGLREVLDYAEVLLNRDDIDAKADAFIDFLSDRVVGKAFEDGFGGAHRVATFADLERLFRSIFDGLELSGRSDTWRTHHIATIRKVRNRLSNISTRCKGLVTDDGPSNDLPWGRFEDRAVYVVDVANVDPLGQDLVFARIVSQLREHLEHRDLGVDAVAVFVDELNKYAPADGPETYVRKMLLDISERGRYLGLVLFGAEQFRSQVHRRVVGNAGTVVFGRMDSDELATPGYQVLSPAVKIKLATLPIGELMVRHPHFTQPIFVRFPRPAVLRGRDGVDRFPPAADLPFEDAVVRQLARLDRRVRPNLVKDLIADRPEEDGRRALAHTRQTRPQDAFAHFKQQLGGRVVATPARESVPRLERPA
jgi:DNA helicase HerA-like ATPase